MKWLITTVVAAGMIYVNMVYIITMFNPARRGPPVWRKFRPFRYTDGKVRSSKMLDGIAWWEPLVMCTYFNFFCSLMLATVWPDQLLNLLLSDWATLVCAGPCVPVLVLWPMGLFFAWRWPYTEGYENDYD